MGLINDTIRLDFPKKRECIRILLSFISIEFVNIALAVNSMQKKEEYDSLTKTKKGVSIERATQKKKKGLHQTKNITPARKAALKEEQANEEAEELFQEWWSGFWVALEDMQQEMVQCYKHGKREMVLSYFEELKKDIDILNTRYLTRDTIIEYCNMNDKSGFDPKLLFSRDEINYMFENYRITQECRLEPKGKIKRINIQSTNIEFVDGIVRILKQMSDAMYKMYEAGEVAYAKFILTKPHKTKFISDWKMFIAICNKYCQEIEYLKPEAKDKYKMISYNKTKNKYHWNGTGRGDGIPLLGQFLKRLFELEIIILNPKEGAARFFMNFFTMDDPSDSKINYLGKQIDNTGHPFREFFINTMNTSPASI